MSMVRGAALLGAVLLVATGCGSGPAGTAGRGALPAATSTTGGSVTSEGSAPAAGSATAATSATSATAAGSATSAGSQTATGRPSALGSLTGYLREVDATDAAIRHAAALVNSDVTAAGLTVRPATRAAVEALDAQQDRLAKAFPAGMSTPLARAAILVFSNLASRAAAMNPVRRSGDVRATDPGFADLRGCLAHGAQAVARYRSDLAALRALAAASPAFTPAAPSSRASAEAALQTELVRNGENCCASCGGYVGDKIYPVVWGRATGISGPADGMINGIDFTARYRPDGGWTVEIHAG